MIDCSEPRTLVVKLGTAVLLKEDDNIDKKSLVHLHDQIAQLRSQGHRVVLVSSGAVGLARSVVKRAERPVPLASKQVLAAIGQLELMNLHQEIVGLFGGVVAQVLLTRTDLGSRASYLNARNTLNGLLDADIIPVVNENDSVSTEEIRFGDNDLLSALVGSAVDADIVINLTQADGLLAPDSETQERVVVPQVTEINEEVRSWVISEKTALGTGGMLTKLDAAEKIFEYGGAMVIAASREPNVLLRIVKGEPVGTWFVNPQNRKRLKGKKRWVAHAALDAGTIRIDEGAGKALKFGGKSLLTIGATAAEGSFDCGDIVSIVDDAGEVIGRGLVNFDHNLLQDFFSLEPSIKQAWLEAKDCRELIHRDNLFIHF